MRIRCHVSVLIAIAIGACQIASATPANKKAFEKFFGPALSPGIAENCSLCHIGKEAHGATKLSDFPHNPFGNSIAKTEGGDFNERLEKVLNSDPDDDGRSSLEEILLGTSPGKKDEIADDSKLKKKLARFESHRNRYPWRPFQSVQKPPVPKSEDNWPLNEIDRFIAAEHGSRGLKPRPPAPREVWLRRVSLDLTGLAPTPDEIRDFCADRSENAHQKVVDRLLASPHYGERWGRHWMDVWRYSDWAGYRADLRESARHIWNWRDWIVESLNEGIGYDEMIRQMFAADELYPGDEEKLRATGYLARNYHRNRNQWMDDVVTHTSQAFLGITMGCSKCHDHMYDPFPQEDYYSMRAIFESYQVRTDRVPGELDIMKNGLPRAYDNNIAAKTYLFERGDERFIVKDKVIPPAIPASLGGDYSVKPVKLPLLAYRPWRREFVQTDLLNKRKGELEKAKNDLEREFLKLSIASLEDQFAVEKLEDVGRKDSDEWKTAAIRAFESQRKAGLAEAKWKVAEGEEAKAKAEKSMAEAKANKNKSKETAATRAMSKAKKDLVAAQKSLTAAEKKMKEKASTKFKPRQGNYPNLSSGRRRAFAKWLIDPRNPLTARVAMNQIWMRHFKHGIVPTVNDFGGNGREPTHPALLDWLAAEFMECNWSMKDMHRKIVLSATYRQSGTPDESNIEKDPDNLYLWRMPSRRMEGELVRDNLLWVSGRLDQTIGGPDIDNKKAQESTRRSIYLRHAHEKLVEFVQIFDGPKVTECYLRHDSVQPHQALALHNSPLTDKAADQLAAITKESEDVVAELFLRILGRHPSVDEETLCREFLLAGNVKRLAIVLLNHNDFVNVR